MKNPDDDKLWFDSLDEGGEDNLAAESLAGMLSYARRRRRRRKMLAASAVIGALGVLLCLVPHLSNPSQHPSAAEPLSANPTVDRKDAGPAQIHFLTDDELLSRFPDRPVALIGPPGDRQLVFLDRLP